MVQGIIGKVFVQIKNHANSFQIKLISASDSSESLEILGLTFKIYSNSKNILSGSRNIGVLLLLAYKPNFGRSIGHPLSASIGHQISRIFRRHLSWLFAKGPKTISELTPFSSQFPNILHVAVKLKHVNSKTVLQITYSSIPKTFV
jgi:hypothetical protein